MGHTVAMSSTRLRIRSGEQGATAMEACAALALASAATLAAMTGTRPLACALRVQAARTLLVDALLEARREAYARESTVSVRVGVGRDTVTMSWTGASRLLGDGVTLTSAPADGDVQFRASGLADNATLALACSASTASVVVNQRGVIR